MNNEEVRLECSPKLVKGHSEVNCAHPPLVWHAMHIVYKNPTIMEAVGFKLHV